MNPKPLRLLPFVVLSLLCAAAVAAGTGTGGSGAGGGNGNQGGSGGAGNGAGGGNKPVPPPQTPLGSNPPKPGFPLGPPKGPGAPPGPALPPGVDPQTDRRNERLQREQPPVEPGSLAADLRLRWGVDQNSTAIAAAIHDATRVYAASNTGDVTALNLVDGSVAWSMKLGSPFAARGVLAKNRLIAPLRNGDLVALDIVSGSVRSTAHPPGMITAPLATDGATVYGVTTSGLVIACDPATLGSKIAYRAVPGLGLGTPLLNGGSAVLCDQRGLVVRIDLARGTELWHKQIFGSVTEPLLRVDGTPTLVLVPTAVGDLAALDIETGEERWRAHGYSPFVGATQRGTEVLAVFANGRAFVFQSATGKTVFHFQTKETPVSRPILDGKGFLLPTLGGAVEVYDARWKSQATLVLRGNLLDAGEFENPVILSTDDGEVYRWQGSP